MLTPSEKYKSILANSKKMKKNISIIFFSIAYCFMFGSCESYVEKYRFSDNSDRKLQAYQWRPKGNVKALVFIAHGYQEWLLPYYQELAEEGAKAGLLMFGHDHLGHGFSSGKRGQIKDVSEYVQPVLDHCRYKKNQYPGVPLFIIGNSLGGLVAVLATLKTQRERFFKGAVLASPLIKIHPDEDTIINRVIAKAASKVLPDFMGEFSMMFSTSDKYWIQFQRNDKNRVQGGTKAGLGQALFRATDNLQGKYNKMTTPFLMMMTSKDRFVSPDGERQFFDQAASWDKTIIFFNNGVHHFYIEKPEIRYPAIKKTINWIEERV